MLRLPSHPKRTPIDVIAPRSPFAPLTTPLVTHSSPPPPRPPSPVCSLAEDVLAPGDFVREGGFLLGEQIHQVSPSLDDRQPAAEFHVISRLGTGSYAVVYHVRQVLYRPPPSEDGHSSLLGPLDLDDDSTPPSIQYGNDYAIKCLSKANLDEGMAEVTIHHSLRPHPNIVTLHSTFETSSFLLLLLEYVPGEDLFYFLEQARDHYDPHPPSPDISFSSSKTPPTPTLLSTLDPAQLLSRTRLRLISSMFAQMCDAVAACHAQQIFHRDIKPENFIVTDGWSTSSTGTHERKVVVKLTDFGLSTTDLESSDMDCGSAPYMSYECRNNMAPSYRPRGADIWSLGIVLINMLYHCNPWSDTTQCPSFDFYLQQPANFFMHRFAGMTVPVAEHLANNIFCILDDPKDDSPRMSATEFGAWAKDLPALLGVPSGPKQHKRVFSTSSTQGHPISPAILQSHRPCSRQASITPAIHSRSASRSVSRAPSRGPTHEVSELSTVFDQELDEQDEQAAEPGIEVEMETELEGMNSRSTSNNKRRKRGARRGKGALASPVSLQDDTLASLADASQSLAREISKASQAAAAAAAFAPPVPIATQPFTKRPPPLREPASMFPIPTALLTPPLIPKPPPTPPARSASHHVAKKPSKWKLSFGKSSGERVLPVDDAASTAAVSTTTPDSSSSISTAAMSVAAANVTNLLMGLNAPPLPSASSSVAAGGITALKEGESTWGRGRSRKSSLVATGGGGARARSLTSGSQVSLERSAAQRPVSPTSTRSGRPLPSSAASSISMASSSGNNSNSNNNWRSSMSTTSSAGNSTSAFTRFSNSSMHSFSTTATSVSGTSSWRSPLPSCKLLQPQRSQSQSQSQSQSPPPQSPVPPVPALPKNIKYMTGVPWELSGLPRQPHQNSVEDIFGSPPARKQRVRNKAPKDASVALDTINERPGSRTGSGHGHGHGHLGSPQKLQVSVLHRQDAATSTTDLAGSSSSAGVARENNININGGGGKEDGGVGVGDSPKKVHKGQIHALAKMLSALRR